MTRTSQTAPTAALIVIGSEVLSGKVQDENTPFVTHELRKLGVKLQRVVVIPDDIEVIASEVKHCAATYTWVFTTGGLGPTHDDVTMEAVARAFNTELHQSEELLKALKHLKRGRSIDNLMRLTLVPQTSSLFWGDGEQIWPTVHVDNVYIFPGVPAFLKHRFTALRQKLAAQPFTCHTVYCSLSESELVNELNKVVANHPDVEIGSYPQFGNEDHRVRLTFDSLSGEAADLAVDEFMALIPQESLVRVDIDKDRTVPYT